jgi:hypothetical protein
MLQLNYTGSRGSQPQRFSNLGTKPLGSLDRFSVHIAFYAIKKAVVRPGSGPDEETAKKCQQKGK